MAERAAPQRRRQAAEGRVRERPRLRSAGRISAGDEPQRGSAGAYAAGAQDVRRQAECRDHRVEPVGTYAVRLSFDDLHTTGIYTWDYLYELGARQTEKWAQYLAELEAKGLSRDRPGEKIKWPE